MGDGAVALATAIGRARAAVGDAIRFGLGEARGVRLNGRMPVDPSPNPLLESLAGYPEWLVAACATVVAVVALWVIAKVLKWSLYLLMVLVLIGGIAATVWLIFN